METSEGKINSDTIKEERGISTQKITHILIQKYNLIREVSI